MDSCVPSGARAAQGSGFSSLAGISGVARWLKPTTPSLLLPEEKGWGWNKNRHGVGKRHLRQRLPRTLELLTSARQGVVPGETIAPGVA